MPKFEEAQWTIPHCKFEETPEGFKVSFTKRKALAGVKAYLAYCLGFASFILAIIGGIVIGTAAGSGWVGFFAFIVLAVGFALLGIKLTTPMITTNIEVNREAVIIDGKRLRLADFGHFSVGHTIDDRGKKTVILGYQYGPQSFEFGGGWDDRQATEFLSGINHRLRATQTTGDASQPSPEMLRAARSMDF